MLIFKGDERLECGNYRPITILQEFLRKSFAINCLIILTVTIFYVLSTADLDRSFPLYLLCRKVQTVGY